MNKRSIFWFLLIAALAVAAIRPGRAEAYQPRLCWTHPTQMSNGAPLSLSQIEASRISYGSCIGYNFGTEIYQYVLQGNKNCVTTPNLQPGTYCYRVATKVVGVADWSAWSASTLASKIIIQSPTCGAGCHGAPP